MWTSENHPANGLRQLSRSSNFVFDVASPSENLVGLSHRRREVQTNNVVSYILPREFNEANVTSSACSRDSHTWIETFTRP